MSQDQVAINAAATRNLADRLSHNGYTGDPMAEAEQIVRNLLAEGLAPVRRPEPIPVRGGGGSAAARAAALAATAEAVAAAKAKGPGGQDRQPMASPGMLTKLAVLLSEDGIKDRQDRLDWAGAMVGRDLASSSELTRAEAHRLIESLEAPPDEEPPAGEQALAEYRDAVALNAAMGEPDPEPDVDPDDGTEPEPDGDPESEAEYRIDQDTWHTDDDQLAAVYSYAGVDDSDVPF